MQKEFADYEQLYTHVFHLLDAKVIQLQPDEVIDEQQYASYTLLVVVEGNCSLYAGEQLIPALQQHCAIFAPHQKWYIGNYSTSTVRLHRLTFKIFDMEQEKAYSKPLQSIHYNWGLYPYARGIKLIEQITALANESGSASGKLGLLRFKRNQLFVELIGLLLEHNILNECDKGALLAAKQSIHYMDAHYMDALTVKELATRAGMVVNSYIAMIKQLTGVSPLTYLNQVRIKHAKTLLLTTKKPLRDIAQGVGFTDEYYFNRRFRQLSGMTPRQYAKQLGGGKEIIDDAGNRVTIPVEPQRIIYYGEALGDLWEIGLFPIAANNYKMEQSWLGQEAQFSQMDNIGIPFNVVKARQLEPDLIILSSMDEKIYNEVSKIAPTITYNSHITLEKRLLKLGGWFNKEQQAKEVIDTYVALLQRAKEKEKQRFQATETASVFMYDRGTQLFFMGAIGLSELLYQLDGLQVVDRALDMIEKGIAYQRISEVQIANYAGNHIFLLLTTSASAKKKTKQLVESATWKQLPAVKNGHVYFLEEQKWNLLDAYSRLRQLEAIIAKE